MRNKLFLCEKACQKSMDDKINGLRAAFHDNHVRFFSQSFKLEACKRWTCALGITRPIQEHNPDP